MRKCSSVWIISGSDSANSQSMLLYVQAKGYRVGPVYDDVLSMAWVFLELIVKSMTLEQSRMYTEALPPGMLWGHSKLITTFDGALICTCLNTLDPNIVRATI